MKRLVVIGGGESGVGAAVLGKVKGMDVWLTDMGAIAPRYKEILDKWEIAWEEGHHTEEKVLGADEIVKSPGVPLTAPLIVKAMAKGIPVISEIELAGRYTDAKMVCITGSNGKTTTTLLTYHIFKEAGLNVGLAGNVGKSLAMQVATEKHDVYVIELSSFQLDNMYDFKANIAVMLNITPDHLDRYDHKMENYTAAKFRIMQNQTSEDAFIYWEDDPIISAQLKSMKSEARMFPFSARNDKSCTAYLAEGIMHINVEGDEWEMPCAELSLKGLHNVYNSMAASISASLMDIKKENIRKALASFEAVEHRL